MMKKSNKKGFTLVELIVVIAIMAILAAVLVPTVTNKIDDANKSSAVSEMGTIASSINAAYMSNQTKPTPATNYAALVAAETEINNFGACTAEDTTIKHGNYKITITPEAGKVTIAVVKGSDTIESKVVTLTGYTA